MDSSDCFLCFNTSACADYLVLNAVIVLSEIFSGSEEKCNLNLSMYLHLPNNHLYKRLPYASQVKFVNAWLQHNNCWYVFHRFQVPNQLKERMQKCLFYGCDICLISSVQPLIIGLYHFSFLLQKLLACTSTLMFKYLSSIDVHFICYVLKSGYKAIDALNIYHVA